MQIFPLIIALMAPAFFLLAIGNIRQAFNYSCGTLSLAATAVLTLGSTNFLIEQAIFSCFLGLWILSALSPKQTPRPLEVENGVFILLSGYTILSALILPRLFSGDFYIFSVTTGKGGLVYENDLPIRLTPVAPSFGNISQSLYLIFAGLFFAFCVRLGRRYGPELLERGLMVAAWVTIILGLLDVFGLDPFLDVLRTASYKINDHQTVSGFDRTIGATSEASRFGLVSGVLLAYFITAWLYTKDQLTGWIAWLLLFVCLSTVSSTAFLSIGSIGLILLWRGALHYKMNHKVLLRTLSLIIFLVLFILLIAVLSGAMEQMISSLRGLTVNKAGSESGRVRTALALKSIDILRESYGLGAGAGTATANGILFVWFANIGIPGALLFGAFYYLVIKRPKSFATRLNARRWFSSSTAVIVYLIAEGLGRTLLDPGLLIMLISAICVTSRAPLWITSQPFIAAYKTAH